MGKHGFNLKRPTPYFPDPAPLIFTDGKHLVFHEEGDVKGENLEVRVEQEGLFIGRLFICWDAYHLILKEVWEKKYKSTLRAHQKVS